MTRFDLAPAPVPVHSLQQTFTLGADLILVVDKVDKRTGHGNLREPGWVVRAFDSDGNVLADLAHLTDKPDGATLELIASVAVRHFPGHIELI